MVPFSLLSKAFSVLGPVSLLLAGFVSPVESRECVSPQEIFAGPQDDLTEVDLGAVRIFPAGLPGGDPALLGIHNCGPDKLLGVWIPWSEASASPPAVLVMSPKLCEEQAPQRVEVVLQHYAACQLTAFDDDGNPVDSASAAPTSDVQTLVLQSPLGIRRIAVTGAETCVLRVCWECEVEFPEDDCVEAGDLYTEPAEDLLEVELGWALITPATLPTGTVVPLSVDFCDEDSASPGIWIPWSEASASPPARITLSPNICRGQAPQRVEVVLKHFNYCELEGRNESGVVVANAVADPTSAVQTLVLESPAGIRTVVFNGSEICVVRICWECEVDFPEDDCVEAGDLYTEPATDLKDVNLGGALITPASLPTGEVVPLSVDFCTEDASTPGVFIPWSEDSASPPARITLSPNLCEGQAPRRVEVTLRHFNYCKLEGYDDGGSPVAAANAAPGDAVQTLVLQSPAGIRTIAVNGSEVCVLRICWECDGGGEPREWFRRGDSNADGSVDISDGVTVLDVLFLGTQTLSCDKAADMNDDGALNVSDAIYGLNALFLGGPPIPPPSTECGPDLTPDSLSCNLYPESLCR